MLPSVNLDEQLRACAEADNLRREQELRLRQVAIVCHLRSSLQIENYTSTKFAN